MKAARGFPIAVITDKNAATVTSGHPWIYEDEIISIDSTGNGSLVDVTNQKGAYLGTGLQRSVYGLFREMQTTALTKLFLSAVYAGLWNTVKQCSAVIFTRAV